MGLTRRNTTEKRLLGCVALGLALALAWTLAGPVSAADSSEHAPVTRLEDLVERLRAMPGFQARFHEEKTIALLAVPLESRGVLYFSPPQLLLRRVEEPTPSLLRVSSNQLVYTDESGSDHFDLGASAIASVFAHTFTDILAGDLERLRETYELSFRPEEPGGGAWQLDLKPRDPRLARAITRVGLSGRGLVLEELVVREGSGDISVTRFHEVDTARRFEAGELERLQGFSSP